MSHTWWNYFVPSSPRDGGGHWTSMEDRPNPPPNWERMCLESEDEGPSEISIHRDDADKFWLMLDPRGTTVFQEKEALAGPFDTLEGAQTAYLVNVHACGWRPVR